MTNYTKKPQDNKLAARVKYYNYEAESILMTALVQQGEPVLLRVLERGIAASDLAEGDNVDIFERVKHLAQCDTPIMEASVKTDLDRIGRTLKNPTLLVDYGQGDSVMPSALEWAIGEIIRSRTKRTVYDVLAKGVKGNDRANGNQNALVTEIIKDLEEIAEPTTNEFLLTQSPDDEGNAQSLATLYADTFLYCDAMGWLFYNGQYWQRENSESRLDRAAVDTLKSRRIEAVKADNEKLVKATKPSATNVRGCKFLFRSLIPTSPGAFDADPDLLNCKNGVVNLRTGEIAPHSSEQRFTYCLPVAYDPEADDSTWVDWLYSAITPEGFEGDEAPYVALLNYLQAAIGYSLTGHTIEQVMFYIHGRERAGKGLLFQTLSKTLGKPLSFGVDFDTFTAKRGGDSQNFDLAPLKPARFVTASESNRTNMLNAKMVKGITGNDPIYCAHKFGAHFEYTPQFKIWLSSNFKVMADANDSALWGRLRVINFPNSYAGREDLKLANKLQSNLEGVLKWAVAGAMQWYKQLEDGQGLGRLDIITSATQAHRDENDTVQQFIDECCKVGDDLYIVGKTFTYQYTEWCKENNITPLGGRRRGEAMRAKDFKYGQKKIFVPTYDKNENKATREVNTKGWFRIALDT